MYISRIQRLFGVGPTGAAISIAFLVIAALLDRSWGRSTILVSQSPLRVLSAVLAAVGLGLHGWSMWTLRKWWGKDALCTNGPFRWFRHPMYAAWITFITPGLALYLNSWIFLMFAVLLHPVWHRLVTREEEMMFGKFPYEYPAYAARTGRFFPRIRSH